MKMIDVYNKMAKNQIQLGTKLIFDEKEFEYGQYCSSEGYCFIDEDNENVYSYYDIDSEFLNKEVELIPPKEEKYLIKVTFMGFSNRYLAYSLYENDVIVVTERVPIFLKSRFTKSEMGSIPAVKKFLEDFQGEYELIRLEDNEID